MRVSNNILFIAQKVRQAFLIKLDVDAQKMALKSEKSSPFSNHFHRAFQNPDERHQLNRSELDYPRYT